MRLFITGTDTGVGKTLVACSLVRGAISEGLAACGVKPIESGCLHENAGQRPADALALAAASSVDELVDECRYRFAESVAPGVAADDTGVTIDLTRIHDAVAQLRARFHDLVVVEGAGGLLVPLGAGRTFADLASTLAIPILIVARAGLGTINHTLLTIEAARARCLSIAGFVLSHESADLDPGFVARNRREIEIAGQTPCAGELAHMSVPTPARLAEQGRALLRRLRAIADDRSRAIASGIRVPERP